MGKSVGCSVGNCTGHPVQMAHVGDEESATPWASLVLCVALEDPAGRALSHRDLRPVGLSMVGREMTIGHNRVVRDSRAERRRCHMRCAGSWEALFTETILRGHKALTRSCLCRLGVAAVSPAIVLRAGCLFALVGVIASSRQNAGRGVSLGRFTLSAKEGRWTAVCT